MSHRKKVLGSFSLLVLASLACTTVTGLFQDQPATPQVGPTMPDDSPATTSVAATPTAQDEQSQGLPEETTAADDDRPPQPLNKQGTISATGDAAAVAVTELNWHEDEEGKITFLGKLQNNGAEDLVFVEVAFILRDENGRPVTSDFTYAPLDVLPAGESSPFEMYFYEPPYDPWASYEILIEGDVNEFFGYYPDFEVVGAKLQTTAIGYEIVGEIENTGSQRSSYVEIYVVVYNQDDEIIAVDFTFAEEEVLDPGETSSFTLPVWSTLQGQTPDHFELYFQGNLSN